MYIICPLIFSLNLLCLTEILDEGDSDSNTDQDAGSSEEEDEEEEEEGEDDEGKVVAYSTSIIGCSIIYYIILLVFLYLLEDLKDASGIQ